MTRADVLRAYELVLRRPPEAEQVVDHLLSHTNDPLEAVAILMGSAEYKSSLDPYRGYDAADLSVLARHAYAAEPVEGFITDFLGSRTDISFNSHLAHLSGTVEGLPVPASFHAEAIEWIGTLKAVDTAGPDFAVAEIGAGWGPWLVAAATAARRLGKTVFMAGVEADPGHFASMRAHIANNQFDPDAQSLLQGAIGPVDGWAFFPRIQSELDWGAAAVFQSSDVPPTLDYRGHRLDYDRVPAFSIATALKDRSVFDLVHIDVQGSERDLMPAAIDVLGAKVRWIVLGTHSRAIEGEMIDLLSDGWSLEHEKPCQFKASTGRVGPGQTLIDGSQVWRNRSL